MADGKTVKRREYVYPTEQQKRLLDGLSAVTGESKSKMFLEGFKMYLKTLSPEIIEAAKFRRSKQN